MTSIVATFSFGLEKEPIMVEFKKIAQREGKDKSKLIVDLIEQYVKYHKEGNSTFTIDRWNDVPDFQAIPSLDASIDKWMVCYKNCNEEERTLLRIQAMNLSRWFRNVDLNEKTVR